MNERLQQIQNGLNKITKECRIDMHEPDEQGIECILVGDHLDNACGEHIDIDAIQRHYQEYVLCLKNDKGQSFQINLADLIALARMA